MKDLEESPKLNSETANQHTKTNTPKRVSDLIRPSRKHEYRPSTAIAERKSLDTEAGLASERNQLMAKWRTAAGLLLIVLLAGHILLPKLGSLVPATTLSENPSSLKITEKESLIEDPFFLPERFIQAGLVFLDLGNGTNLRLVSVAFALASLLLMFWLLSMWHTRRVALISTLLFGCSSWFLHQARWAEPDVMYLAVIPILLLGSILLKKKRYDHIWPLTIFMLIVLLYLPGIWALILLFLLLNYEKINKTFKYLSGYLRIASIAALVIPITPLVYSLWQSPWLIKTWLGFPDRNFDLSSVAQNLYEIPKQLLVTGPDNPIAWVGGTPILDVATTALIIIGIYSYRCGLYPVRWRALAGLSIVSIILISLGGLVSLSLIIPIAYIFACNGVALLLQQWFTVFPRNPFARSIGITALFILVLGICSYHLVRYYIAWPHAQATYQAVQDQTP